MNLRAHLTALTSRAVQALYGHTIDENLLTWNKTRKEFEGDFTLVVFPLLKISQQNPEITATQIGEYLNANSENISRFNVVKGFLNVSFSDAFWVGYLSTIPLPPLRLPKTDSAWPIMVEYSSPNTNKPLHLGHIRNNLLGYSVSRILEANGHKVIKTQVINDRGIHICKSMVAWLQFGNGETPENSGLKGDKLVGKYYVLFDKEHRVQKSKRVEEGVDQNKLDDTPIMRQAQEMLRKWEKGDPDTLQLWQTMNAWVYTGFESTYRRLGVAFDRLYYESETYLHGKDVVLQGLSNGVFQRDSDGSVWCDLTDDGHDRKILLRSDGTSVYMTQDIGTALLRIGDYPEVRQMIYTVGNEQDYHFAVLFKILGKLGFDWAEKCYHLSYGMVDLPEGKMKSREGTVVDADDLMQQMFESARETTIELGKMQNQSNANLDVLSEQIGMAALKYFILKVDPRKRMMFNPRESVDLNGNTGPFIQYTHARICSILRKAPETEEIQYPSVALADAERKLIALLYDYEETIAESAVAFAPSLLANYLYDLAKSFNGFYQTSPILNAAETEIRHLRWKICQHVAHTLKHGLSLLGIEAPERM